MLDATQHWKNIGKVLESKPSIALTKSNNAVLYVRHRSFRSAQLFDYIFSNALSCLYLFLSSFFLISISSSSSSSSAIFPIGAIDLGFFWCAATSTTPTDVPNLKPQVSVVRDSVLHFGCMQFANSIIIDHQVRSPSMHVTL